MIDKKQIEDEEIIGMFQYFLQYFNGYQTDGVIEKHGGWPIK